MLLAIDMEVQRAFDHVEEALGVRISKLPVHLHFGGVLRERGTKSGTDMHDSGRVLHPWQGRSHKSIRREQEVIWMVSAARVAKIMHGRSSSEIQASEQVDPTNEAHSRVLLRRPLPIQIP